MSAIIRSNMNRWMQSAIAAAFLFCSTQTFSQIVVEDGRVRANFGIDADLYSDSLRFGTFNQSASGTDDWYWDGAGSGEGVIDTTGAAGIKAYLQGQGNATGTNISFVRNMAVPKFTDVNGYLWLDATFIRDNHAASGAVDSSAFTGSSSKNAQNPKSWGLGVGNTPSKNDIIDFYAHLRRDGPDVSDSLWSYLAVSTLSGDGNSYFDVEFFRGEIDYTPSGGLQNLGSDSGHTKWAFDGSGQPVQLGDVITALNFINGGATLEGKLFAWVNINDFPGGLTSFNSLPDRPFNFTGTFETISGGSGQTSPFGYAEIDLKDPNAGTVVFAQLNDGGAVGAGAFGTLAGSQAQYSNTLSVNRFAEFGINLTALGLDLPNNFGGECGALFGGIMVKTRTSASFNSALKDFAGPSAFGRVDEAGVTISGNTSIDCNNSTTTLSADVAVQQGVSYQWFEIISPGDNDTLGTNQTQVVDHAGVYWVEITILAGCTSADTVTVIEDFTPPTITGFDAVDPTCFGGCDGSAKVNVSSGTPPFSYDWSDGQTTQTAINLCAGTYTVIVTGANGCADTGSVTLTAPQAMSLTAVITDVSCFGGSDGAIDLTVSGGTSPYSYSWSNGATTEDIFGLSAGIYSVTVTDVNSCSVSESFTVDEPEQLVLSGVVTPVSCFGFNDGSIDLSVSGGTFPYSYSWSNGETTQDIFNLFAGSYLVTVTDANGCIATAGFTVTQPPQLVLSGVVTHVTCFGGSNGAINLTVVGGTPGYSYLWSNGATTEDIVGVTAGSYTVTVTDANSCQANMSFTVTQPPQIVITGTVTHVTCFGFSDGAIDISVSGGVPGYTYLWSTSATTQDISGLSAGTYIVTVTDANGCNVAQSFTVNEPDPLTITAVISHVSCFGDDDGSIDVTVTGGTAPYSYSWSTGSSNQDLFNLTAGTYSVTVTDANSCVETASFTVTEPDPLSLSGVVTPVSCFGGSDGAIDLSVTGGTTPYSYSWSNGSTNQDIFNISAGNYTVVVTDANSCVATMTFTVTQPTAIVISGVITHVTCNGGSDGAIDVSVNGGTPGYTYLWSNGETTQDIINLSAATYTVIVTDNNGCNASMNFTVTQPTPIVITAVITSVSCFGFSDGAIDVSVSGGTPGYTYLWSTGATTQDISGLFAGSYTVTVTDNNSCEESMTFTVTEPDPLSLSATITHVSCNGLSDGSIDLSVSGGTAPFSYLWSTGSSNQDIFNLSAGTYSVTVTDFNQCVDSAMFTVTEPDELVLAAIITHVTCFGSNNGAIDLSVTGGTQPYSYSWSNGSSNQDLFNIVAGTYIVTVTDANSCVETANYTVTEPPELEVNSIITHVSCNGFGDGAIDISVSGGTPGYSYLWSNGETTQDISGLDGGTYSVTITDANNCVEFEVFIVNEPDELIATGVVTNVSCNGLSDGAIDLTVSGGTIPYSYDWSNGSTNQDVFNLVVGTYSVTVTDANSCVATATFTITEPDAIVLTAVVSDALCNGAADGSIDLSVAGGTSPYSYQWSNGSNNQDIFNLTAGTYIVTVTDANGCVETASYVVNEPTAVVLSVVITHVSCFGFGDGAIDLTVTGGTPPYTYNWSNGAITEDIFNLSGGVYAVTVTDAQQCITTAVYIVDEPDQLVASGVVTNVSCNGLSDGTINLTVAGGTIPYTYMWSNGATDQDVSNLSAGTYSVTVLDANECEVTVSFTVTEPDALMVTAVIVNASCNGFSDGSIDISVTGGTTPYSYNWSNGSTNQDLFAVSAGTYSVTITDNQGCVISDVYIVTEPDALVVTAVISNVTCNGFGDGSIDISVTGGTAPYTYNWSNGELTEDISNLSPGVYIVTVTDAQQCIATETYVITEPDVLALSGTLVHASCNGLSDGSIDLTVTGGTLPYSYNWSNGSTNQDVFGLSAGVYSVTVLDANECEASMSFTITEPDAIVITAVVENVTCNGLGDGSIDISVSGGTAPYTYIWSTGSINQDLFNLTPGTYIVTVTDAQQCVMTANYTITQPDVLALTEVITHVSCNGLSDAAIDITVTGGTTPYNYNWSNGPVTEDISGLSAGSYSVTILDANECELTMSFVVTEPDVLAASATSEPATCNGFDDGSIDLSVTGGTLPYAYNWSNGEVTEDIANLMAGVYTVTVTDDHGCEVILDVTVTEPTAIDVTVTAIVDASCGLVFDGAIDISVSGGIPPYTYNWSNGEVTEDISNLSTGVYSVTVMDANECVTIINDIVVGSGEEVNIAATVTPVSCPDGNDGSVILTITGGTAPYTYLWSNGQVAKDLVSAGEGLYTVIVTDVNGCQATAMFSVIDESMNLNIVVEAATCGSDNGAISVTVNGGSGNFSYAWSSGDNTSSLTSLSSGVYTVTVSDILNECEVIEQIIVPNVDGPIIEGFITAATCGLNNDGRIDVAVTGGLSFTYSWSTGTTTEDISGLAAGDYWVTVTSQPDGCVNVAKFTVGIEGELTILGSVTDATCGEHDGAIALGLAGAGPYIIQWSTGDNTQNISGLAAGAYLVTVTDVTTGCSGTAMFGVSNTTGPDLSGTVSVDAACAAGSDGFVDLSVSGNAPFAFNWSTGANTEDLVGLTAGVYAVEVTDASGCKAVRVFTIGEPDPFDVLVQTVPNCEKIGPVGQIHVSVTGGIAPYSYGVDQAVSSIEPPYLGLRAGDYGLTITDANGCDISAKGTVSSDSLNADCLDLSVQVPEVLTPNGDGIMDEWNIQYIEEYPNNEVMIFNRWGDMVFRTIGYANNWYGKYMDTDRDLPDGTYYFIVKLNDDLGREFSGFVMIHR